jgi:hypothetical protein
MAAVLAAVAVILALLGAFSSLFTGLLLAA